MPIAAWPELAPHLVDVAMGRTHADIVIRNGRWVNVHSGEIIPGTDVAIAGGRFAAIAPGPRLRHRRRDHGHRRRRAAISCPGLCDGHMHVESGMVTVTEFCRAVIPHGTTSMFIDPHEIANVLGLPGVRLMHDEAVAMPINVFVQMPSCVPSAPGLENAGASIDENDVAEAMAWPNIIGLGEMMNFPGVAHNDTKMLAEIAATQRAGKTVGGHYASPDLGRPFHGLCRRRPGRRPRGHARRGRHRPRAAGHARHAAPRLGLVRRRAAGQGDHRARARSAQLHPLHRRPLRRHAGQRRPHGPRRCATPSRTA